MLPNFDEFLAPFNIYPFTRPNIAFALNHLSQFMHKPLAHHWATVKCVLRYLSGTQSFGLFIRKSSYFSLYAIVDANWARNLDDRTSTSMYILFIGSTPIS